MSADENGMAILAVCAHEFGHIVQYDTRVHDTLSYGQPTVKLVELHADFLAGYYLGLRQSDQPSLRLFSAGAFIHDLGDNNFTSPTHHGTKEERTAALEGGYRLGRDATADIGSAISSGVEFVQQFS